MVELEVASGQAAAAADAGTLADVFASPAAFDAWYGQMLPRVYGYVFNRCGHNVDLAEELTQLTFVDAVRCRDAFTGRSDAFTWLCSIARHKVADHYRRLDGDERRNLRLVERMGSPDAGGSGPDVAEREVILRAFQRLPAMQRAVLVFTGLDDLSVREAAELLERTEAATESLLHRARVAFRQAYLEEGGADDA